MPVEIFFFITKRRDAPHGESLLGLLIKPKKMYRYEFYIFVIIPCFVELRKFVMFFISRLSGTCCLICRTESKTLFMPWKTRR